MLIDDNAFFEQVFEIIEGALQKKGYKVLEGDETTSCIVSPDGINFDIKLQMCYG